MVFKGREPGPLPTKDILSWIFDETPQNADRPVAIDATETSRSHSFSQAKTLIQRYIAGLKARGVKKGDCVLLHSFNDIDYPLLALAIIGSGAIFAGSNPTYTAFELEHHMKVTATTWIIPESETLPTVLKAAKTTGIPNSHIIVFNPLKSQKCPSGFISYKSLLNHGSSSWVRFDSYDICKNTTAARYTSSGTSGLPKACINTHLNLIAQHEYNFAEAFYKPQYDPVKLLFPLPLFHASVSPRALTTIWKRNEMCYLMRRFEPDSYVRYIERFGITDLTVVPPMAVAVLNHAGVKDGTVSLKSVKNGIAGAAPLTRETQKRFMALLAPNTSFNQIWGMTETNCLASRFEWDEFDDTGSIGWLCPGLEAKLVDLETGTDLGDACDVRGEMCVRGEGVVPGYFDPASDKPNRRGWDEDGFYHSGDVMYKSSETGKWYIVDRVKELIKSRGFQVAPPEVEGVLLALDGVLDAAVIGVKDVAGESEVCRGYIVRRPGSESTLTEEVVNKWVSERLVKYKWLEGGIKFVDAIPKTPSGKILKRLLREEYEREQRKSKL
ncbi:4-coumarate--CoA ligase-like 7 [Cyphellophora attinorum]|uniref:4-coumarate--CoA ligase-like 7 n=1 Tax=Cyphellophora attinorum TaxID=1664694 RepID=A0A0N1HKR1_9EURO|nr:4-coumarate--CoA ligase-like 7 [Phialophora attinorum]KPI34916.1 4-coumarate--CoA ligase-like 7 [Phialophora attinorum]